MQCLWKHSNTITRLEATSREQYCQEESDQQQLTHMKCDKNFITNKEVPPIYSRTGVHRTYCKGFDYMSQEIGIYKLEDERVTRHDLRLYHVLCHMHTALSSYPVYSFYFN